MIMKHKMRWRWERMGIIGASFQTSTCKENTVRLGVLD